MPDHHVRSLGAAVERQMRNWELSRIQQDAPIPTEPVVTTRPFVTISRMVGSGGGELARRLADATGWPLFDRELLQHMSGDDALRTRVYESLDERDMGFIEESMAAFTSAGFRRNDYYRRLAETLLALARQGSAIFLGRGADLLLPRDRGLRVRVISPLTQCARHFAERNGISVAEATREVERIEQDRDRFIRSHAQIDPGSPTRFDVVLNLGSLTLDEAAEALLAILRKRALL